MAETNENGIYAMGHAYANSAQTLIRLNLPSYIPESMRSKSFAEIASLKNTDGENIGIRALHEAWDTSQALVSTANPLNTSEGQQLRKLIIDLASLSSGSGMYDSQLQDFMIGAVHRQSDACPQDLFPIRRHEEPCAAGGHRAHHHPHRLPRPHRISRHDYR